MHDNQQTFEARDVVRFYAASKELQAPETTIFGLLEDELARARLLDIGIGGGRTTRHLAKKVKEYVGVDYAAGMVAECKQTFPELELALAVADVREMKDQRDASFDVTLFSFNGIDYIDHEGRLRALAEVRRVTKPGGAFVFSTHNLLRLPDLFALRQAWNPAEVVKHLRLRMNNEPLATLMAKDHAAVNDGSYAFRSTTYYVKPLAQLAQLADAGFPDVRTFSLKSGVELDPAKRDVATDPWLYFLCR